MYEGFLKFADIEVINSSRSRGYATSAECPLSWFQLECESMAAALGQAGTYQLSAITQAPWYDPRNPESERFYGVHGISLGAISDSTSASSVVEGVTEGGTAGASRRSGRTLRLRVWLSADGMDALDYGHAWLEAALGARRCPDHDLSCGGASAEFFATCPPERGTVPEEDGGSRPQTDEEYAATVELGKRFLHGVKMISGPIEIRTVESQDGRHWGREVEFTLYAERPGVYSAPRRLDAPPSLPSVVQDVPYNLAPYPSAELASGTVIVIENLSTNPSVETDATGWTNTTANISGVAPTFSSGRSTELAASGAASYAITATGQGVGVQDISARQDVTVAPVAGSRYSATIWGAVLLSGSGGSVTSLAAKIEWRNGSTVLRTDALGTITSDFAGHVFSQKGIAPPAGAVTARIILTARINLTSSTVAKLFADALAVTIP